MRLFMARVLSVLCLLLGLPSVLVRAESVLDAIPPDVIGFAVVHNLTDASRSIDNVAKLVQAPAPDLLSQAKNMTGVEKGLDEQGDAAIVLISVDPTPKGVVLVPVADFADFCAALGVEQPDTGIVNAHMVGKETLVGRKGNYAVIAPASDRDALEQLLGATTNLSTDAAVAAWLDANQVSFVVTPHGMQQLLPKLTDGIRAAQENLRQVQAEQGQIAADALNMYLDFFTAVQSEVDRFGVGLQIDSAQNIDVVKHVRFAPGGACAQWAANAKPAAEDLLAGLPADPYVAAIGGVMPQGAIESLMKFSVKMMQSQPMFNLSAEQAQEYADISTEAMSGVRSMAMLLGVAEPGTGLYGNTTAVMTVDDAQQYIEGYEKTLAAMREFAQEAKSPLIPVVTSERIKVDDTEVLEVSTDLSDMQQFWPPGSPDPQRMMQLLTGREGKLKVYVAPADEHTIVMAYTSVENLKTALEFCRSNQPGLSSGAGVAQVASKLPPGSQWVAYLSLSGVVKAAQRVTSTLSGGSATWIPDFPECPPLGIAAKVSPSGAEGHLVVMEDTLRAIGDVVAKIRGSGSPQQ